MSLESMEKQTIHIVGGLSLDTAKRATRMQEVLTNHGARVSISPVLRLVAQKDYLWSLLDHKDDYIKEMQRLPDVDTVAVVGNRFMAKIDPLLSGVIERAVENDDIETVCYLGAPRTLGQLSILIGEGIEVVQSPEEILEFTSIDETENGIDP